MRSFKYFLLVSLIGIFSVAALAQSQTDGGKKSDNSNSAATLTGDWELTIAAPTGPMPVTGTIKQNADGVSGSLKTPYGPAEVKSGKLTGNQFTIAVRVNGDGNFNATLTGNLDGDKMKGSVATPQGDFNFTGVRKSATASSSTGSSSAPMAAGDWTLTVTSPNGDLTVNLSLKQDGENLTGSVSSQFGQAEITNGKLTGNKFSIPVTITIEGNPLPITFNGSIDGENMKGAIDSQMGSFDFTGTRKKN